MTIIFNFKGGSRAKFDRDSKTFEGYIPTNAAYVEVCCDHKLIALIYNPCTEWKYELHGKDQEYTLLRHPSIKTENLSINQFPKLCITRCSLCCSSCITYR